MVHIVFFNYLNIIVNYLPIIVNSCRRAILGAIIKDYHDYHNERIDRALLRTPYTLALKIDDRYCNVTPLFATLSQYATSIVT